MAFVGMTGQGATVNLSVTGAIGCIRSIKLPEWTQEKVDASCLNTTGFKRYIAGDLTEPGQVEMTAVFDPANGVPDPSAGELGAEETITVTFPVANEGGDAAVLTGKGFLMSVGLPSMEVDNLLEVNFTFCFNGDEDNPPTFTPGTNGDEVS